MMNQNAEKNLNDCNVSCRGIIFGSRGIIQRFQSFQKRGFGWEINCFGTETIEGRFQVDQEQKISFMA